MSTFHEERTITKWIMRKYSDIEKEVPYKGASFLLCALRRTFLMGESP